jgi:hypothetical protein
MKGNNMNLKTILLSVLAVAAASGAQAAIVTYSGQDDGAPVSGPFPNSNTTASSFLTAAAGFGPVYTETFDSIPVGTAALGGTFSIPGASVSITTPFSEPYGGVSSTVQGNVYGFPISGSNFLAFDAGSATFTFNQPTNSFGFYTTGVQTVFTSVFTVTFNDGVSETLNIPINVNGGASYFGFTDTVAISSVTVTNLSNDAWAVDNVSFNAGTSAAPEASTWAMMGLGFAGLAFAGSRTRKSAAVAA